MAELYTYQGGRRIPLAKAADEFIVRGSLDHLESLGLEAAEAVSARAFRVGVPAAELDTAMQEARETTVAHHAYYVEGTDAEFLITDRILVTFRPGVPNADIDALAAKYGLLLAARYSEREAMFQLTDQTGMNPVKLVVKLNEEESRLVEFAEHDLNRRAEKAQLALPTDPLYQEQWHLHRHSPSTAVDSRSSVRCEEAWHLLGNFGSASIVVAVSDDGCRLDHPDFASTGKFAGWGYFEGERLVTNTEVDAMPGKMFQPGANHGTACAGVIAADVNGQFVVGGAPGVRLLPIKFESSGSGLFISDSKLRAVLDYIATRADVFSNSWGTVPFSFWSTQVQSRMRELARNGGRRGRGIVFLFAAGNDNCPIEHSGTVDIPYTHGWQVNAGGNATWIGPKKSKSFSNSLTAIEGVMHVGALASNAQRSHYSNYGAGVVISAPSSNVHEYRRLSVPGLRIVTASGTPELVNLQFGGTSSATPLVAAVAALTLSANPELTAIQTVLLLKQTASKDLNVTGYARTPAAPFDPDTSWDVSPVAPFDQAVFQPGGEEGSWSPWFGHGRVDALAAVQAALGMAQQARQVVERSSSPGLAIPDNNATGVEDAILVTVAGLLRDVRVTLRVTHTWIGDLRVRLIGPDGAVAILHNRTGAGTRNLQREYTVASTPDLAALLNRPVQGAWRLSVQDVAPRDQGTLDQWSLRLEVEAAPLVFADEAASEIPDGIAAGVIREINVPLGRIARGLTVRADVSHPAVADLVMVLTTPGGAAIPLAMPAPGSVEATGIWRDTAVPQLAALLNRDAGGVWRLQVADVAAQGTGKLNRWSLELLV